jgi:hypothetical protein
MPKQNKQRGGDFSANGSGAGSAGDQFGFEPIRGAPLASAFKARKRTHRQRGAGLGDGTGAGAGPATGDPSSFNALRAGSSVSGIVLSDAAAYKIIPQGVTEQGMAFQKMTSTFHRSRKNRKQRGGALAPAPYSSLGEVLPSQMTGPMTTAASGVLGGSATGVLDKMLVETSGLVRQTGGGKRKTQKNRKQQKKQSRKQKKQQKKQQKRSQKNRNQKKQRGGALGYGPAVPTTGNYNILAQQELKAAGLNPQFFDENQVNPNFGGALTVPGGKLN